jgi:hypothetical protein
MGQARISVAAASTLAATLLILPTPASPQGDLDTCSGRLNYCVEWARRAGAPSTQCAAAYQECQRTGVRERRDLYNPYAGAAARPNQYNPYPGAVDRRDINSPYVGPIDQQFCAGRVNCLPPR